MSSDKINEIGYIIASNMVAQDKLKVGFLYRENPENNLDSGWRVFNGAEDDDYIDDADNFGIYDSAKIIGIDSSIEKLLNAPYKTAFERVEGKDEFVEIHDFEFDEEDEEQK